MAKAMSPAALSKPPHEILNAFQARSGLCTDMRATVASMDMRSELSAASDTSFISRAWNMI